MRFRLTPKSMTFDDLELYKFDATTAKQMKIDQYCQRQRCM